MSKNAEVQTQAKAYKDEIAELTKVEDVLKDNIEKCENEKKRLELLVKSDETKHELETQITKLKEESDAKVQKVHDCKVKQQEYKQRLVQFQKYLKELQHLTVKHETIQKTRQEIEQIRQGMSEEEIAASDLESKIAEVNRQNDE